VTECRGIAAVEAKMKKEEAPVMKEPLNGQILEQTPDPNEKVLKSFRRYKEHQDVVPKQEKEAQGVSIGM